MGRRKFRLSDMMPDSWFFKLRDMRRARGHPPACGGASAMNQSSSSSPSLSSRAAKASPKSGTPRRGSVRALSHRTSYYYPTRDRGFPPPPPAPQPRAAVEDRLSPLARSPTKNSRRRHRVGPVSSGLGMEPVTVAPDAAQRRRDMYVGRDGGVDLAEVRRQTVNAPAEGVKVIASDKDMIIDLQAEDYTAEKVLRPIVTRPAARRNAVIRYELKQREIETYELKERHVDQSATTQRASSVSEEGTKGSSRRSSVSTGRRLKTRANSPRLVSSCRKGKPAMTSAPSLSKTTPAAPLQPLAECFAVVKASDDPRRDFRESMEEMIAEKRIRDATDLEDLLSCYLTLNAAEYHDLIVEVFEQIWTSLANVRP